MENLTDQPQWLNQVYYRWVFLPVLAHLLSFLTGLGMVLFFPLSVTIAHYLTLKQYEAVRRPALWFMTLPVTLFIWFRWGPIHYLSLDQPNGILYSVGAYYGGQLLNAFLIPFMTQKHPFSMAFTTNPAGTELTMRWLLATTLSAGIWVTLYSLFTEFANELATTERRMAGNLSMLIIIPGH